MTVYIEYVILDNFVFTLLIAYLSFKLMREKASKLRCVIASIVGTLCAVFYPFVKSVPLVIVFKLSLGVVMCLILYVRKSNFLRHSICFLICTALIGGIMFMIGFVVHGNASAALRLPVSELPLSIFFLPPIALFFVIKTVFDRINAHRIKQSFVYDLRLTICGKSKEFRGFIDTGNTVKAKKDVVFIGRLTALDLLGSDYFMLSDKVERIEIATAVGTKNIMLLSGKIELYLSKDEHIFMDVQVGISDIKNKEYEVILPLSILDKERL